MHCLIDDFYEIYRERYNIIKNISDMIAKSEEIPSLEKYRLKPNYAERFIANLRKILEQEKRGHF